VDRLAAKHYAGADSLGRYTLPHVAVYGPPTSYGTGHFWFAWYFQMRKLDSL